MERKQLILNKIIELSLAEANKILVNAETRVGEILTEARIQSNEDTKNQIKEATKNCEANLNTAMNMANFEKSQVLLQAKNDIIDNIFVQTLENLLNTDAKTYKKVIKTMIEKCAQNEDEILLAKNSKFTKENLLSLATFKTKNLKFAGETDAFSGGIKISNNTREIDLSFEALVNEKKHQVLCELANELFSY